MGYITTTEAQRQQMLETLGLDSMEQLYRDTPGELRLKEHLRLPAAKSQMEISREYAALADKSTVFRSVFRGAGAYKHYIPSIVKAVTSKETFVTAYTPYQAEISQGILQSIFEYQTMVCELTGMDVSNASVYDGATAAAEAVAMCADKKHPVALISACAHPDTIEVIRTYCWASGLEMRLIPAKDGCTDLSALEAALDERSACVYVQQPNFFGQIEDAKALGAVAKAAKAKYIMGVNPISMALLETPGECGADIAVGEGQPLGMPLAFGGPYLGFMASTKALMRKLPGRIVGQTVDAQGERAFVLALQAREQHIRREKASSNICSNQALCAMTAACYLATMGPDGLREVAAQSYHHTHYLAEKLGEIGFTRTQEGPFFHEFVTTCPVEPEKLLGGLRKKGILGGLPVKDGILWCCTECNDRADIDALITAIKEVCA